MKNIPVDINLGEVSLPGTHDSMAQYDPVSGCCGSDISAQTQGLTLLQQLNAGIRYIDVRAGCYVVPGQSAPVWLLQHGPMPLFNPVTHDPTNAINDVMEVLKTFLTAHPSETVIMAFGKDGIKTGPFTIPVPGVDSTKTCDNYTEAFQDRIYTPYKSLFWDNGGQEFTSATQAPKLSAARGHVILEQTFFDFKYPLVGLYADSYYCGTNRCIDPSVLNTFDQYANYADTIWSRAKPHLDAANHAIIYPQTDPTPPVPHNAALWRTDINGASCFALIAPCESYTPHSFVSNSPHSNAFGQNFTTGYIKGTNQQALSYLLSGSLGAVGTLAMDYPSPALIDAVIALNFSYLPADHTGATSARRAEFDDLSTNIDKVFSNYAGSDRFAQAVSQYSQNFWSTAVPGQLWNVLSANDGAFALSGNQFASPWQWAADGHVWSMAWSIPLEAPLNPDNFTAVAQSAIAGLTIPGRADMVLSALTSHFTHGDFLVSAYPASNKSLGPDWALQTTSGLGMTTFTSAGWTFKIMEWGKLSSGLESGPPIVRSSGGRLQGLALPTLSATVSPTAVRPGATVTVTGTGFNPGEQISAVLHSTPVSLGAHIAGSDGNLHFTAVIPGSTPAGTHLVTLTGASSKLSASASLTVTAAAPAPPIGPPPLANTGAPVGRLVILAVLLLIAGGATARLGRARRVRP